MALLSSSNPQLNYEELSGQYQGDIILSFGQKELLTEARTNRVGIALDRYHWPNKTVPYAFVAVFNDAQLAHIELGIRELTASTCIKFVPRTTEPNYIRFTVILI